MIGGKGDMQVLNETGMAAFEESIRKALEERRKVIGITEQALGSLAFPCGGFPTESSINQKGAGLG